MRILHVITLAEPGGAQSVVIELANRAAAAGHRVAVMSRDEPGLWDLLCPQVTQFRTRWFVRNVCPLRDVAALAAVLRCHSRFRPDVVHLHSSKAGIWGRVALAFTRTRIIYTVHGFDSIRTAHRRFLPIERWLGRRRGITVPVSDYDRKNLLLEGIPAAETIHNGVSDQSDYSDFPLVSQSRPRWRIITVARIDAPKRFDLFVQTASLMPPSQFEFFWIGNRTPITGLPAHVHCLGQIPDARRYLRNFHVMLLPSDYEGLPMSILEALAAGIPVVASDVGGVREAVFGLHGKSVANEAGAMATAIAALCSSPENHATAANAAREVYIKRFSADRMWLAYERRYMGTRVDSSPPDPMQSFEHHPNAESLCP